MFLTICITKPNNNFAFIRINEANSTSNVQNFLPVSYRCKLCTHHLILKPDCPYTCIRCIKNNYICLLASLDNDIFFILNLSYTLKLAFPLILCFWLIQTQLKYPGPLRFSQIHSQLCLTHKSPPPAVRTSLWQFNMKWQCGS